MVVKEVRVVEGSKAVLVTGIVDVVTVESDVVVYTGVVVKVSAVVESEMKVEPGILGVLVLASS